MRTIKETFDRLMSSSSVVKNKGLSEEDVRNLIHDYQEALFNTLLENGYVNFSEAITVEIVRLTPRKHVLRGVTYYNDKRRYKLKVTFWDSFGKRIADSLKEFWGE